MGKHEVVGNGGSDDAPDQDGVDVVKMGADLARIIVSFICRRLRYVVYTTPSCSDPRLSKTKLFFRFCSQIEPLSSQPLAF